MATSNRSSRVTWSRRQFLQLGAVAGLGSCTRRPRSAPILEALVDGICESDQQDVLHTAAEAKRAGASAEQLLLAAMLTPILSGGDEGDVHAVMVVPAILEHVAPEDLWLPAFWAVANAQAWSRRPARPAADDCFVDPAAIVLAASRRYRDPHVAIYAAQAWRAVRRLPERFHAPLWRSVLRHADRASPPDPDAPPVRGNEADTTPAEEIAESLVASPHTSLDGLASAAIWEALARIALRTRLDPAAVDPIHQTTQLDARWLLYELAPASSRPQVLANTVAAILAFHRPRAAPRAIPMPSIEALRRELVDKGTNEHDFKYFAAVENVASKLPPRAAAPWWGAASVAHPFGSVDRWDRRAEAQQLIADDTAR